VQVRLQAKPGWAAAQGSNCVVVLATELTAQLIAEGWVRDLVHSIQAQRKELNLEYTARVELGVVTDDAALGAAVDQFGEYIKSETLAVHLSSSPSQGATPIDLTIGSAPVQLYVRAVAK
jgi:isoleucyl-tRNA synthetase